MEHATGPDLGALTTLLVGTWRGPGAGSYPTIADFAYVETVVIGAVPGKPFLTYEQTTRSPEGAPLHRESGYWRVPTPGSVELVVVHPIGIVEVLEGTVVAAGDGVTGDGVTIDLASTTVALTATAKDVRRTRRVFTLAGGVLGYRLAMAAVGQPLTHHLAAELRRQPEA